MKFLLALLQALSRRPDVILINISKIELFHIFKKDHCYVLFANILICPFVLFFQVQELVISTIIMQMYGTCFVMSDVQFLQ